MRPEAPQEFIDRLTELLAEARKAGITIPEIAAECGFHRSLPSKWLKRESIPTGTNLANLAFYFGVTMDWLWGRPGYPRERGSAEDARPSPFVAEARARAEEIAERERQRSQQSPRRQDLRGP